jgi:hypothetical protein
VDPATKAALIGAILTGLVCLLGQWLITSTARAKTEGMITQALTDISARQDRSDKEVADQRDRLTEHAAKIGRLEGRVGAGKANGASI